MLALAVESNVAASGEARESSGDRAVDLGAGPARERAEAINESEAAMCIADEVKNGKARLAFFVSKAAPELLQEDCRAFGRAEEQHRVDARDIETLIEEVAYEQDVDLPGAQLLKRSSALRIRRFVVDTQ